MYDSMNLTDQSVVTMPKLCKLLIVGHSIEGLSPKGGISFKPGWKVWLFLGFSWSVLVYILGITFWGVLPQTVGWNWRKKCKQL